MMRMLMLLMGALIVFATGCTPLLKDGPYVGRVIDAVTGEPVEGAVVALSWYKWSPTLAGSVHKCFNSVDTITDSDGKFIIDGYGLMVFSNIDLPHMLIIKCGYWPEGPNLLLDRNFNKEYEFKMVRLGDSYDHERLYVSGLSCTETLSDNYKKELSFVRKEIKNYMEGK